MMLLILASCKQKEKDLGMVTAETMAMSFEEPSENPTCFTSYQIYEETAYIWQQSWLSYYGQYKNTQLPTSPIIYFGRPELNQLYQEAKNQSNPGILLYYVLTESTNTIPALAIVNTVDCNPVWDDDILLSEMGDQTARIIPRDSFDLYQGYWVERAASARTATPVYAYNYSWQSLYNNLANKSDDYGMAVKFGLRTIEPDDIKLFSETADTTMTGSVVYCNIIAFAQYGSNYSAETVTALYDFAMPCPEVCGDK